jgi:hypothetical protein
MSAGIGSVDRRLLAVLGVLALAVALRYTVFSGDSRPSPSAVAPVTTVPVAQKRLEKLREQASTVEAKEAILKSARADLDLRDKGIIKADTAAQAQAHLLDTIHRIAANNGFDARGADQFTEVKPLGTDYGVVAVTESFTCGIEQLVNFLSVLANEPEILATSDIHVNGGNDKNKNVQVRLTISGVVSRNLVPKKKGNGA